MSDNVIQAVFFFDCLREYNDEDIRRSAKLPKITCVQKVHVNLALNKKEAKLQEKSVQFYKSRTFKVLILVYKQKITPN